MTNVYEIILLCLLLVVLAMGGVCFYYMAQCYPKVKEGKQWIFLTPFWLLAASMFDENGNRYRVAALKATAILVVLIGVLLVANEYK
jgi:hypothetical protein